MIGTAPFSPAQPTNSFSFHPKRLRHRQMKTAAGREKKMRKKAASSPIGITDGKPSDIVGNKNTRRHGRTMDYAGRAAVLDLAQEVTKGKSQGIKIVGLLIGRDENLDSFETVFGHNRLHLKDPMDMTDSLLRALRQ